MLAPLKEGRCNVYEPTRVRYKTVFMKLIFLTAAFFFSMVAVNAQNSDRGQTVNAIIGDESLLKQSDKDPQLVDEQSRIAIHLSYVEGKLREKDLSGLSESQKRNRMQVLDFLNEYRLRGDFPSNLDYEGERRPCFIDRYGTICAVGYLIEKTAGLELAEWINEKHQYDFLLDMKEDVIEQWADEHGFTLEECAMIQPSYGWNPPPPPAQKPISKSYGISSGIIGGLNLGVTAVNMSGRLGNTRFVSHAGLITGVAQLTLGLANLRKDETVYPIIGAPTTTSYKAQNNLSYLNMAVGTATIVTSALNLYLNSKIVDKRNAVGLYSAPGMNRSLSMGIAFSRSL